MRRKFNKKKCVQNLLEWIIDENRKIQQNNGKGFEK